MSLKTIRNITVLLFLLMCAGSTQGQERLYFESLSVNLGLSNRRINSIVQDDMGFIWFGTTAGLYRYDGHEARVFRHDSDMPSPLSSSFIYDIILTSENKLWIGTARGLNIYDKKLETFTQIVPDKFPELAQLGFLVLLEDSRGLVWAGSSSGLYYIAPDTGEARYLSFGDYAATNYENEIRSLAEDTDGNIWIGTSNGLYKYVFDEKKLYRKDLRVKMAGDPHNNLILSLLIDPVDSGILWVGSETGLHKYDYSAGHSVMTFRRETISAMLNNRIRSLDFLPDSTIVFGTDQGLYTLNRQNGLVNCYRHSIIDSKSVSNDAVRSIYRENSGIVWFGTDFGVSYVNSRRHRFNVTQVVQGVDGVVNQPMINNLIRDSEGNIWLATYDGVLKTPDNATLALNPEQYLRGLTHSIVRTLHMDNSGILWAGTDNGLHYLEKGAHTFVKVELRNDPLATRFTPSLLEDSKGNIWVCASDYGLCRIKPYRTASGRLSNYEYRLYNLVHPLYSHHSTTWQLNIDADDNIWAMTYQGEVFRYDADSDELEGFGPGGINGLIGHGDGITNLHLSAERAVYISTNRGLYKYDNRLDSLVKVNLGNYTDTAIGTVEEDKDGNLWLATPQGLLKYGKKDGVTDFFRVKNDFNLRHIISRSCFRDAGNNLYFGGKGEFLFFDPASIKHNERHDQPLYITRFLVNDKDIEAGGRDRKHSLEQDITLSDAVRLAHTERSFKIHFSLLDYEYPQGNTYVYMLEGFDKGWNTNSNGNNVASYTNIPPGKYRFMLHGSYNSDVESENARILDITIDHPWWASWWSYCIYTFIVAALIYLFYRMTATRIRLNNELKYHEIERKQAEELNQHKLRFFTNVSHEFRTPLTLMLDPIDQVLSETGDKRHRDILSIMKANGERLLRLVNQIMDFRKVEYRMMKLELYYGDVVPFLHDIFKLFADNARMRNIKYTLECRPKHIYTMFDRDKIEKTVYNLISNAFKFTPDRGEISLSLDLSEIYGKQYFMLSVKDNGTGIDPDEQPFIFERFYQGSRKSVNSAEGTGIGLVLSKEFVDLHNGRIGLVSAPDHGSEFTIFIPVAVPDSQAAEIMPEELNCDDMKEDVSDNSAVTGRPRILIVEDNEEMNCYIAANLEQNYEIITAVNGGEGWQKVLKYNPDLVISDIMMPGETDGIELCRKIKTEFDSRTPVILLTAKTDEESVIEGFKYGADDYIVKPFTTRMLKMRAAKLLESRQLLREHYKRMALESPKNIIIESEDDQLIADLVAVVEENIDNSELKVDVICQKLDIPHYQLYRRLKSLTGQNVNEFVRTIRIKRAAQLFQDTNLNISEVMYRCGFNTAPYFARCFQEQYYMKPSEYINQYRKIRLSGKIKG